MQFLKVHKNIRSHVERGVAAKGHNFFDQWRLGEGGGGGDEGTVDG